MEFKTYNPGEDSYLYEWYQEVLMKPDDVEKYRKVIAEALRDAEEVAGMDSGVEVVFGLADPEKIKDRWGEDAGTNFHIHGFTFGSWFEDRDRDFIFIYANDSRDDWRAALKNMVVHERAHVDFYNHYSDDVLAERLNGVNYNSVLFEGHSTNMAAKLNRLKSYGWSPEYRKTGNKVDFEKLMAELEKDRTESEFFNHGGEEWEEAEGYPISFEIFTWIIENKGLEVEDLPSLSEDGARELIDEAAEELYR